MKGLNKAATIITKILEVFHWVGTALMAAATICSVAAPQLLKYLVSIDAKECCGAELSIYGFEVHAPVVNGGVDMTIFLLFGIGATIIFVLMALVFRNVYLVFKKSENATPFQKENVCRLRKIGIFSIAVPVIGFVMSIIVRLVAGDVVEVSVGQSGIFMGIVVLCLTQYFSYGAALEEDVDGLV